VKYGLLVRMMCETELGYLHNIKIYRASKKLEDIDLSVLENNMALNQQIYRTVLNCINIYCKQKMIREPWFPQLLFKTLADFI
jgi:hypothetical protein